jgi:hypothetical protein
MTRIAGGRPWLPSLWPAILLGLAAGCAGLAGGGIGEIHLFGIPTALMNMEGQPGAGGIGLQVYASEAGGARGVPIRQGRLEILMFDAAPAGLDPRVAKPLKVWSFAPAQLDAFAASSFLGKGYQLALKWEQARPVGRIVTVVARYRPSSGVELYSLPSAILVAARLGG